MTSTSARPVPAPMTRDELADTLTQLADAVRAGDSLEGSISYLLPYDDECGCEAAERRHCPHLAVEAAFRVGNRRGQGGMQRIGRWEHPDGTVKEQP